MPNSSQNGSTSGLPTSGVSIQEIETRDRRLGRQIQESQIPSILSALFNTSGGLSYTDIIRHRPFNLDRWIGPMKQAIDMNLVSKSSAGEQLQFELSSQGRRIASILAEMRLQTLFQSENGKTVALVLNQLLDCGGARPEQVIRATGLQQDSALEAFDQLDTLGIIDSGSWTDVERYEVTPLGSELLDG